MTNKRTTRTARKHERKKQKKSLWKRIALALATILSLIVLGVIGTFIYFIATAPELDISKIDVAYSSKFYDKDGEMFADMGTENRIKVQYEDLPQVLIDAVIATEDARFFEHPGIDLRRIAGAIVANIKHGFGSEGASTITQQVVEHLFLSPEKKLKLKVQEQWLALQLERELSKEQILEIYLNKIFYGNNAYGVAKAAEVYFGIEDLHDLNLVQAAMLAGLPQRPSAYNPFENPDLMQERVHTVLDLMVRHNKITKEEAEEAKKVDIRTVLTDKKPDPLPYEAFRQQVIKELEEKLPDVDIFSAGLEIHTTLDQSIQSHVEFLLTDSAENPIPYPDEDLQAGMAVLDTKTGEIRAIGGSRNRENVMGDNYAIKLDRQPGSTIKPLLSFGPAIEYEKWSTYHQVKDDKPYRLPSGHEIRNWNRTYQGQVSIRTALKDSLNVPTIHTFMEIGPDRAKKFAENLGIKFADKHLAPNDAIGGTRTTVTPLQMAGAFSAFGNEGIYTEPHSVKKVVFPDGSVIDLKPKSEAVMADYTAYMVTDILKDVLKNGTGRTANIPHLPVAGKTGTTNVEGKSGANNSWFVGYTTNYTIGVWAGYSKEHNRIIPDTRIPQHLFRHTMTEISKDIETPDFKKPDSVVELPIIKGSNPPEIASENTPSEHVTRELFVKGTEPTNVSTEFEQLEPVKNLTAVYNEAANRIDISWDYDNTENIVFKVDFSVDSGDMRHLTTTEEMSASIDQVQVGSTYTIQVVAIDEENDLMSEPQSVKVTIEGEEEEEEEEEENVPPVSNLNAQYDAGSMSIVVQWSYNGPPASFEVTINGPQGTQTETVTQQNLRITNVLPGETYTINVTPVSGQVRGETRSVSITTDPLPQDEEPNDGGGDGNGTENENGTDHEEQTNQHEEQM